MVDIESFEIDFGVKFTTSDKIFVAAHNEISEDPTIIQVDRKYFLTGSVNYPLLHNEFLSYCRFPGFGRNENIYEIAIKIYNTDKKKVIYPIAFREKSFLALKFQNGELNGLYEFDYFDFENETFIAKGINNGIVTFDEESALDDFRRQDIENAQYKENISIQQFGLSKDNTFVVLCTLEEQELRYFDLISKNEFLIFDSEFFADWSTYKFLLMDLNSIISENWKFQIQYDNPKEAKVNKVLVLDEEIKNIINPLHSDYFDWKFINLLNQKIETQNRVRKKFIAFWDTRMGQEIGIAFIDEAKESELMKLNTFVIRNHD